MNYHEDDRAQRLLDVFPLKEGQVNVSLHKFNRSYCCLA